MITIEQTENLVNVAVLGEFTIADFKSIEEQSLYKLKSPGELNLLFDLRAMVSAEIALDQVGAAFDKLGAGAGARSVVTFR